MKAMKAKKFPEAIPAPGCISVHPSRNLLRHAGHILRLLAQILRSGQPEFDVQLTVSANHNIIDDCYDGFLTWYFPECGRSGPDMDKIKETCPIDLNSIRGPGYLEKSLSAIALKKKDP